MKDIKLFNLCDHKIIDEIITIEGSSPSFTSKLFAASNKNKITTFIRGYDAVASSTIFSKTLVGITNYSFSADGQTIIFGGDPVNISTIFPDNTPTRVPPFVYKADYVCVSSSCPRCRGTKSVKDIFVSTTGKLLTVETRDKIKERILKTLLTYKGTNVNDENYGSGLQDLIGEEISLYTSIRLQKEIQDAINHLMDLQYTENLTPEETITRISNLSIEQDTTDPTLLNVLISVTTASYDEVTAKLTISL